MDKIKNFLKSRYGVDHLSLFLVGISILLTILSLVFKVSILYNLSYIPLLIALVRTFSGNIDKRKMENYNFFMKINPIYKKIEIYKKIFKERKDNKFFKCPSCKTYIRVPRGKGRINVTCSKCKTKFEGRS